MALFVDIIDIRAKAGDGGNGCVSFHREKFVQQGGPDGGDGGKGGDIAFVASERMRTLMDFRFKRNFSAGNGADGSAGRCRGKAGEDIDIEVPVGTVVREKASGRVLLDMRKRACAACSCAVATAALATRALPRPRARRHNLPSPAKSAL